MAEKKNINDFTQKGVDVLSSAGKKTKEIASSIVTIGKQKEGFL